jgi:hypothetical protein
VTLPDPTAEDTCAPETRVEAADSRFGPVPRAIWPLNTAVTHGASRLQPLARLGAALLSATSDVVRRAMLRSFPCWCHTFVRADDKRAAASAKGAPNPTGCQTIDYSYAWPGNNTQRIESVAAILVGASLAEGAAGNASEPSVLSVAQLPRRAHAAFRGNTTHRVSLHHGSAGQTAALDRLLTATGRHTAVFPASSSISTGHRAGPTVNLEAKGRASHTHPASRQSSGTPPQQAGHMDLAMDGRSTKWREDADFLNEPSIPGDHTVCRSQRDAGERPTVDVGEGSRTVGRHQRAAFCLTGQPRTFVHPQV